MSPDFITKSDGSGRQIRPQQFDYLTKLSKEWGNYMVFACRAEVGFGKSMLARTIQRTLPNVAIVTSTNQLVDQYVTDYPELVGLKGKDYYAHIKDYTKARQEARVKPFIANPLSYYYYYLKYRAQPKPDVVIIDEAHKLAGMLLLTVTKQFNCQKYGIPSGLTEVQFLDWLSGMTSKLSQVLGIENPTQKQSAVISQAESLYILWDYLRSNLHNVKIAYEMIKDFKGKSSLHLTVRPLQLPTGLLKTIFGDAKLVLMSGTLTDFDLDELFPGEPIHKAIYELQAPLENSVIYHASLPPGTSRSDYSLWALKIHELWLKHNKPNTLVHVTYDAAERLRNELRYLDPKIPVWTHDKETKQSVVDLFKARGGILLGSGMAEGVDLPGDLCRMVIVPKLFFPNLGDDEVKKRLAMPNGQTWYNVQTVTHLIQALGRGLRGADDACTSYIFDPLLKDLIQKTDSIVTPGFKRRIRWNYERGSISGCPEVVKIA